MQCKTNASPSKIAEFIRGRSKSETENSTRVNLGSDRARIGTFSIHESLIEQCPALVMEIMSHMIVLRAEHRWDFKAFDYVAYSPYFEKVEEGMKYPEYLINIISTPDLDKIEILKTGD